MNEKVSYLNLESLFKFIILSAITSLLILLNLINEYNYIWYGYNLIHLFLLIVFFFKIGISPFHIWIPEIYLGLNLCSIIILSTLPKITTFIIWTRLILNNNGLYYIILLSLIISCIGGLNQSNIKILFAYSSIYNFSIIIIGLYINTYFSLSYSFFYIIIYILTNLGLFIILNNIYINKFSIIYLNYINNKYNYLLCIFIISLIGIPPFSGFLIKTFFFKYILFKKYIFLNLIIIITNIISSFYYMRIIKIINDININNFNFWLHLCIKNKRENNKYFIFICIYIIIYLIYIPSFYIIMINYIYLF